MIAALICGRAENQPFPGRNTFPLLGRPLMVYPILAAIHSDEVKQAYLSTDDPGMARVARHHGAVVIDRPPELAGPSATLETVIEHGYREIVRRLGTELEALVVLLANAPTVTSGLIDQGVSSLRVNATLDAVMSVSLRNEFSPRYALTLAANGRVQSYLEESPSSGDERDAYFPDALLWVLRPGHYFGPSLRTIRPNWVVNPSTQTVAALVHEGYGDVDYPWQIPAVEAWLRQRGFTEAITPYTPRIELPSSTPTTQEPASFTKIERRVLITTVPFGQPQRRPLDLLENDKIDYVINPIGRRLKEDELADMIEDFGILIAGTEPITARVMDAAPNLKLISRVGIGLDSVDLIAARERGIHVSYTPDAPSPAVAELAVGLMFSLLRNITSADRSVRNGVWHRFMGRRLAGMTVGVIGVGRIGKRVIHHLKGGFPEVRVLANDLAPDTAFGTAHGVHWVDKETIYREADIITLHLPLTPLTSHLIGTQEIKQMKPTTILINTARGNMIVERDLAEALRSEQIAGAAIDVFGQEPYTGELSTVDRCILTCHMGSMSFDCRARMELEATEEALRFLRSEPLEHMVPEYEYDLAAQRRL
jgi:D-3-phosphoglycerate dehydrogenase